MLGYVITIVFLSAALVVFAAIGDHYRRRCVSIRNVLRRERGEFGEQRAEDMRVLEQCRQDRENLGKKLYEWREWAREVPNV
jgi:hypothetical protein